MTSITEVARLAGVSIATASRVVSESDYPVSATTRERVLEAARSLDYVPNALARGLLKSQIPVVGVIVHDITDPYFSEIVRGVEDEASAGGYLVVTCSSERSPRLERQYVRLLRSMRVAAVVFAGSGLDDPDLNEVLPKHVEAMRAFGSVVIHLSPHADGPPEIGVDNISGVAAMVRTLHSLGHRDIAFLAGPEKLFVAQERLAGFRRGLLESGIQPDERLVVSTDFSRDGGAAGVAALLDSSKARFSAICSANDLLALGAIAELQRREIRVPDDVSVAGFDDISMAALTAPSLSTVRIPLRELGRRAFRYVDRAASGEPVAREVLPTEVVLRGSTAAIRVEPVTAR